MLVEHFAFDKIRINYLVVGHTHSSIDQYFSTLRAKIDNEGKGRFIGSPLGLVELLMNDQKYRSYGLRVMQQLTIIYEVSYVFSAYIINPLIKVRHNDNNFNCNSFI